jgi:hypothetical protein
MKVYNFDPNNGFYLGSEDADESPLEPGTFCLPANSTFVKPPPFNLEEIPKWEENQWILVKFSDMITWKDVRSQRDNLLKKSDWTQLSDANIQNKNQWKIYRQELRDLTKKYQTPSEVIFPKQPQIINSDHTFRKYLCRLKTYLKLFLC